MVTTRSADKQGNTNSKTEKLTLRSKPEDSSTITVAQPELSSESTSTSKSKVLINVPPVRRRTRSSNGVVNDLEVDGVPSPGDTIIIHSQPSEEDPDAVREVPDSQESPAKLKQPDQSEIVSDAIAPQEKSTPSQKAGTKRKRKTVDTPQRTQIIETSTRSTPATGSKHRRFGSEEPLGNDIEDNATPQGQVVVELSDGEDDAPEVATSKVLPASSQPRITRQSRKKRAVQPIGQVETAAGNALPVTATEDQSGPADQEALEQVMTPALKINTSHDSDTAATLQSEDPDDLAFVTARTNRHVDFFATPLGGTPSAASSTINASSFTIDELETTPKPSTLAIEDLTENTQNLKIMKPRSKVGLSGPGSVNLPSKASNTLEDYRRQILQNRAERGPGNHRNSKFKLQADWPGKRSRFLVGC